jgi:hypothetical protein
MRFLVRHSLIALGLGVLVITAAYRTGLEQTAQARSAANRFKTNVKVIGGLRGNREELVEVFSPATQTVTVATPRVSPNSVTVYSHGATSVLLTYTGVSNLQPMEATFCNELVPLVSGIDPLGPSLGFKCKPGTGFGRLPQRYDQSTLKNNTFTDILSVTPQIARRAYLEAVREKRSTFFYVRRFVNRVTLREVAVPVTIRLTGNAVGVPLSLTDVKLTWGDARPIIFVKTSDTLPQVQAEITYTGTGRLVGRWELVKPGEVSPQPRDLLTEATLPLEERGTHRRYTLMSRFNVYLPPTGKILLRGPEDRRMDKSLTGLYQILLRIEATDDTQGVTPAPGVPGESPPSGGVAGFSLPVIKYYVSNGSATVPPATITRSNPFEFSPEDQATLDTNQPVDFTWPLDSAAKYRFEVEDLQSAPVISAILPAGVISYRAPSWFKDKVGKRVVRWTVISFDQQGNEIDKTEWRALRFGPETDRNQKP